MGDYWDYLRDYYAWRPPILSFLKICKCGHYEDSHEERPRIYQKRYGRIHCRGALDKECNCTEFREVG